MSGRRRATRSSSARVRRARPRRRSSRRRGRRVLLAREGPVPAPQGLRRVPLGRRAGRRSSGWASRERVEERRPSASNRRDRSIRRRAGRRLSPARAPRSESRASASTTLLAGRRAGAGADSRGSARACPVDRGRARSGLPGALLAAAGDGGDADARARVIGAWGRWDAARPRRSTAASSRGRALLRLEPRLRARTPRSPDTVRLYAFPGGYCGLSRVEGGAVQPRRRRSRRAPRRRLPGGWEAVVEHARRDRTRPRPRPRRA